MSRSPTCIDPSPGTEQAPCLVPPPPGMQVAWVGRSVLAAAGDMDTCICCYCFESDENCSLSLASTAVEVPARPGSGCASSAVAPGAGAGVVLEAGSIGGAARSTICCLAYEPRQHLLAAATTTGDVVLFKYKGSSSGDGAACNGSSAQLQEGPGSTGSAASHSAGLSKAWRLQHAFKVGGAGPVLHHNSCFQLDVLLACG